MKIAHVTDFYLPHLGGIEIQVHDLATRQQAAGHVVELFTASAPARCETAGPAVADADQPAAAAPETDLAHVDGVAASFPVHRLAAFSRHPLFTPTAVRAGSPLLRAGGYDVVHVHASLYSPLACGLAWVATRAKIPTVVTAHSMLNRFQSVARGLDLTMRWASWPICWTAVSDAVAAQVGSLVAPAPVTVLPNGIDPGRWQVTPEPRDPADVLLVAVMRLAPRKRPVHLLRMLREVRANAAPNVGVRAVVVGDGPERPSMLRYLRRHDMTGWVTLPGRWSRDRIRALYARADAFVAPATLESFGIAALEARCAGIPVVARTEGGVREFVVDGVDGYLADSDRSMVDALTRLVVRPAERERIAAHNRAVCPAITWDDVLGRVAASYATATAIATGTAAETVPLGAPR